MRAGRPPRSSTARAVATVGIAAALFAGVGVLHTAIRVAAVDQAYRLSTIEAEVRHRVRENEQLRVELATLNSPARLEPLGRKHGLVRADPGVIRRASPAALALQKARAERPSPNRASFRPADRRPSTP